MFGGGGTFGANKPFGGSTTVSSGGFGAGSFGSTFGSTPAAGTSNIGSSAFGNASPGIKSFGATPTATGFGGFGAPATGQTTGFGGGTAFGAPAAGQTTGFGGGTAFGAPAAGQTTGFGGGTAFGAPAAGQTTGFGGGTAFGAPATGQTTGFGGTGFGAPTTGQSTGFGSFGSTPGATTAQPVSGFGSTGFGTAPQATTSTTGFGTGFGTAAPSFGSSSGFGTAAATPTFGTSTGGGFGSTTSTLSFGSTGGFGSTGFGSSGVDSSKSTFGSLGFGSTSAAPAATASTGFGSTGGFSSAGSFGSLGSSTVFGGLGSSAPTGFGQQSSWSTNTGGFGVAAVPQQQQQMFVSNPVVQAFEKLQSYYASSRDWQSGKYLASSEGKPNEDCEFKSIMYNRKVDSSTPVETLWRSRQFEMAEQDNTDPENLVPVLELGMAPLKKRFENQVAEAAKSEQHVKALNDVLSTVEMANTQVAVRFESLRMRQVDIYRTLLTLMRKVEVLRCHGQRLQPQELRLRTDSFPFCTAREAQQQLHKLCSSVTMQQQDKRQREVYTEVQDPEDIEFLYHALQKQREGLEYVTDMLKKDMRDVKIIHSLMQKEGSAGGNSNNFNNERKFEQIL